MENKINYPTSFSQEVHVFRNNYNEEYLQECFTKSIIKYRDNSEEPTPILWVGESIIATCGNFSASTGKAKSKKTFNISAIVAAALTNRTILNYHAKLPEGRRKVIYFDTEQSRFHCNKVLNRIVRLSGAKDANDLHHLTFVALREYCPSLRISVIDHVLKRNPDCGLVIIDGLRDLVYDINDAKESTEVMSILMNWTSTYNIHIHCVLHLNKNDNNTRGHLGTELENKAETILVINRSRNNAAISEVRPMHMRDKEFATFSFLVDENALPVLSAGGQVSLCMKKSDSLIGLSVDIHRKILYEVFDTHPVSYKDLVKQMQHIYKMNGYVHGLNTIKEFLKILSENSVVVKAPNKKGYEYNPNFSHLRCS